MSKFGLGKGLSELKTEMGDNSELSVLSGGDRVAVRQIPLNQISANPDQPRKTFDPVALEELSASIKEKGVLQPILVRSVNGRPYQYEIIAGERRFRAAMTAGLDTIPALVKNFENNTAMEIALIENVQRENLNPIEEGRAYADLMAKCGYGLPDVSKLIGKSESYIRNILRLENLPDSVQKMVADGTLSASHARTIAVAADPEKIAREIASRGLSVSDTEKIVKSGARSIKSRAYKKVESEEWKVEIEKKLTSALGAKVKLKERKNGAGDFIVSFDNRFHMERLVKQFTD